MLTAVHIAAMDRVLDAGRSVADLVSSHGPWMQWNLMLAVVPVVLALLLFPRRTHTPLGAATWWFGVGAFVAFLPNAPYVLTDVIHLLDDIRSTPSDLFLLGAVVPLYAVFFLIGMACYVVALDRFVRALARTELQRLLLRGGFHLLCAVGIFVGRVLRFNSWHLVTHPLSVRRAIPEILSPWGIGFIALTFLTLAALTPLVRQQLNRFATITSKFI